MDQQTNSTMRNRPSKGETGVITHSSGSVSECESELLKLVYKKDSKILNEPTNRQHNLQ